TAIHLLNIEEQGVFGSNVFKAKFGRYDVITNVDQAFANDIAQFMDKVYRGYVTVFPYKKNETLRFHLKIFATEGEFGKYFEKTTGQAVSTGSSRVGAYYMPITKELVGPSGP